MEIWVGIFLGLLILGVTGQSLGLAQTIKSSSLDRLKRILKIGRRYILTMTIALVIVDILLWMIEGLQLGIGIGLYTIIGVDLFIGFNVALWLIVIARAKRHIRELQS